MSSQQSANDVFRSKLIDKAKDGDFGPLPQGLASKINPEETPTTVPTLTNTSNSSVTPDQSTSPPVPPPPSGRASINTPPETNRPSFPIPQSSSPQQEVKGVVRGQTDNSITSQVDGNITSHVDNSITSHAINSTIPIAGITESAKASRTATGTSATTVSSATISTLLPSLSGPDLKLIIPLATTIPLVTISLLIVYFCKRATSHRKKSSSLNPYNKLLVQSENGADSGVDQLRGVGGIVEGYPTESSATSQPPNVRSSALHQRLKNLLRFDGRTDRRTRELEGELASAVQQLEAFRAVIRQQGIDPPFVPLNSATPPPDYTSQLSDAEITVAHPVPVRNKSRSDFP